MRCNCYIRVMELVSANLEKSRERVYMSVNLYKHNEKAHISALKKGWLNGAF